MMKLLKNVLILTLCFQVIHTLHAQMQETKVSYPTGSRLLVSSSPCSELVWNNYLGELSYAQITVEIKYCQQYADYLVPVAKPETPKPESSMKWGSNKKTPDAAGLKLIGNHFELIKEKEVFVQTLSSNGSKEEIEKQVILQCRDWISILPLPEASGNLPVECK